MSATIRLRLRLAQWLAPVGYDIHNPDETACPSDRPVLEAVERYALCPDADGRVRSDITRDVEFAEEMGWIELTTDGDGNAVYQLTGSGVAELARQWGHGRVPPLEHSLSECAEHGVRRLDAGDLLGCPGCRAVSR